MSVKMSLKRMCVLEWQPDSIIIIGIRIVLTSLFEGQQKRNPSEWMSVILAQKPSSFYNKFAIISRRFYLLEFGLKSRYSTYFSRNIISTVCVSPIAPITFKIYCSWETLLEKLRLELICQCWCWKNESYGFFQPVRNHNTLIKLRSLVLWHSLKAYRASKTGITAPLTAYFFILYDVSHYTWFRSTPA